MPYSKLKYHSILVLLVTGMLSCTSGLSTEKLNNISVLHAAIEIKQSPVDKNDNTVIVRLTDENGRRVSNDSLTVFVNGIEEKLNHRQGLYYSDESSYVFSNVPVQDRYGVDIKLSDGKKYFLGSVKALAVENPKNIQCAEVGDINKDFLIQWHDLIDLDELSVFVGMTEKTEPNVTTMANKDEKIINFKNSGSFTIPKSEYKTGKSTINGIEFTFRTTKTGQVNPDLLPQSSISIHTEIEKYVTFD